MFNLVLEERPGQEGEGGGGGGGKRGTHAIIEGVPTITLAHGIEGDTVATHTYYGSRQVVEDLEAHFRPDARGVIRVPAGAMELVRDEGDEGRVVKAVPRRVDEASSLSTPAHLLLLQVLLPSCTGTKTS